MQSRVLIILAIFALTGCAHRQFTVAVIDANHRPVPQACVKLRQITLPVWVDARLYRTESNGTVTVPRMTSAHEIYAVTPDGQFGMADLFSDHSPHQKGIRGPVVVVVRPGVSHTGIVNLDAPFIGEDSQWKNSGPELIECWNSGVHAAIARETERKTEDIEPGATDNPDGAQRLREDH